MKPAPRICVFIVGAAAATLALSGEKARDALFHSSDRCIVCHDGMSTSTGEPLSIGADWSVSLMANSARDPYWQASVRRETIDHPESRARIEDECAICHMPMSTRLARLAGKTGEVFSHLKGDSTQTLHQLARDGISCSLCHQIAAQGLGEAATFNGEFGIGPLSDTVRREFGPYDVDPALRRIMRSSTKGFEPAQSSHVRDSALCATCHTLTTQALGPGGTVAGVLHEQAPYQEWQHSAFVQERSCQSCHMPSVAGSAPISSILSDPREGPSRHTFVAANFLMQRMLGQFRGETGVVPTKSEFDAASRRTTAYLQNNSATLNITPASSRTGQVSFDVNVVNLGGHRLPTGYPARRVWLHVRVTDVSGRSVFESGAVRADGSIVGNDNDENASNVEPHHREIRTPQDVQIYESVLADTRGAPTTGLLSAVRYLKDNRLLPRGFDKRTAPDNIAVIGDALADADFDDTGDRTSYRVDIGTSSGPFRITAELRYQPIGFRWAMNLTAYDADETRRFVRYFQSLPGENSVTLANSTLQIGTP